MNNDLNVQCQAIFKHAHLVAKALNNNYVGSEHVLLGILHDATHRLTQLLRMKGISYEMIYEDCRILFGMKDEQPANQDHTIVVEQLLANSRLIKTKVDVDTLSEVLLTLPCSVALELIARYGVNCDELVQELKEVGNLDGFKECLNLNKVQRNQHFVGREIELFEMMSGICRKEKANIILVGEAGVGKTALVERLAEMIQNKQVPSYLQSCIVYELSLTSLISNTKYRGDFEAKIQRILEVIKKNPNIILFIDEIHLILGAGKAEGSLDVSSILKPALARGQFKCIGATTPQELELIEKDRALSRRFQKINIKEPTSEETLTMLGGKKKEYEQFHGVSFSIELLTQILMYTEQYLPQYNNPDKSLDCLDLACSLAKLNRQKNCLIENVKQSIQHLACFPLFEDNLFQQALDDWKNRYGIFLPEIISQNIALVGNNVEKKKAFVQEICDLFHQDLLVLNVDEDLEHVVSEIKKAPFLCLSIEKYEEATFPLKNKIEQILSQGYIMIKNEKIFFKNATIILSLQKETNQTMQTVGFKPSTERLFGYMNHICRIE